MYIHIGGDSVVYARDVVAILDVRTVSAADSTKDFLQKSAMVSNSETEVKSFVVTLEKVYGSPISSLTLKRRANLF